MIEDRVYQVENPEKELRYGVYSVQGEVDTGPAFTRSFIVLRNGYGMIVKFTRLEDYVGFYNYRTYKPITSDVGPKLYYVTRMLNYVLVEHGQFFGIRNVFQINKDEWDYERNEIEPQQVMLNCNKKVWWICEKGHHWRASVQNRTNGTGCPRCVGKTYNRSHFL